MAMTTNRPGMGTAKRDDIDLPDPRLTKPGTKRGFKPLQPASVQQMIAARQRGGPQASNATYADGQNVPVGTSLNVSGFSSGRGRGGYGGMQPRSRISSAGVAGGVPTSKAGKIEAGLDVNMPAWQQSQQRRDQVGLTDSSRFGSMGALPRRNPLTSWQENQARQGPNTMTGPQTSAASWVGGQIQNEDPFGTQIPAFAKGSKDTGALDQLALVGEEGPEVVMMPAHSKVVPNEMTKKIGKFARGTEGAWSALDDMLGHSAVSAGPQDGEIRQDANGVEWRYDASLGKGIPVNPYSYASNAPSRDSFRTTTADRFDDLDSRLSAIRREGFAEGRAAVQRLQQKNNQELIDSQVGDAVRERIPESQGGGYRISNRYGTGTVGNNAKKSFTVERADGSSQAYPTLAEAEVESRADAAQRGLNVRRGNLSGDGMGGYVASTSPLTARLDNARAEALKAAKQRWKAEDAGQVLASAEGPPPTEGENNLAVDELAETQAIDNAILDPVAPQGVVIPSAPRTPIERYLGDVVGQTAPVRAVRDLFNTGKAGVDAVSRAFSPKAAADRVKKAKSLLEYLATPR